MTWSINHYASARAEHAFLLKAEGMTYKEIGRRLGTDKQYAWILVHAFAKKLNRAMSAGTIRKRMSISIERKV